MSTPDIVIKDTDPFVIVTIEAITFTVSQAGFPSGRSYDLDTVILDMDPDPDTRMPARFKGYSLKADGTRLRSTRGSVYPPIELADAVEAAIRQQLAS